MGKRTSYPPGTFSWVDLATTDAVAAKAFYTGLFGWEADSTTFLKDGDAVAGLRETAGAPGWTSYVTVEDADAVVARAERLGGRSLGGHFVADTQGAVLALRRAGGRMGAERVNDVGCLCMNELLTSDLGAARAFYEGVFGWTAEAFGEDMMLALNHGRVNASFQPTRNGAAPHWRACFTVESTHTALERVRELGGTPVGEPIAIPDGSLAVARDPEGVVFSLFAGDVDP